MSSLDSNSLGELLRTERLRLGLTISAIAAETKIPGYVLAAIENGRFEYVPAGSYRRSFLRQYARCLGLDEEAFAEAYRHQYEEVVKPLPEPRPPAKSKVVPKVVWPVAVAIALLAGYRMYDRVHIDSTLERDGVRQSPPATSLLQSPPPDSRDRGATALHVEFAASEPVWMMVKRDGALIYTGTLVGPESKVFDANGRLTVLVGNAGGLAIFLNGKPLGRLGARGQVVAVIIKTVISE